MLNVAQLVRLRIIKQNFIVYNVEINVMRVYNIVWTFAVFKNFRRRKEG